MPYIKQHQRYELLEEGALPANAGELNFIFTRHINDFFDVRGKSYQTFNDAIGALECCKLELYRRMVAPYEDKKIEENGDVYG